MTRCVICSRDADYEGPKLCKRCWLGLKMFDNDPKRLGRARQYAYGGLKSKKVKKFKRNSHFLPEDAKFAQMVSEEKQIAPLKIPEVVASKTRKVKIVKWYNR